MYYYDFEIAGLRLRVSSILELQDLFELKRYLKTYSPQVKPDIIYSIQLLDENWTISGTKIAEDDRTAVYIRNDEIHHYYFWSIYSKERYVLVRHNKERAEHYIIALQPEFLQRILPQFRLAAFLSPERVLLNHNGLILHASVINWQENGILFSAPSGTGKSTQADLWHRMEGAQILNGDRAVIRMLHSRFNAYGSPYAGTSGIYTTGSVPIRSIVLLSQAAENSLRRLHPREAFLSLYQQCTVQSWDPWFVEHLSSLLQDLVSRVDIFHLACRPDADAVELLKSNL